ncbi:MAG: UDP-N-acetylmuramate--L-alanine ligase [Planctomycetes bacterium]|nr:UDP-N-acetylmuramate--L-alanine ligase [Planctomycetota bacterium]MBI3833775.1 UDP-N-acetylmuramate--L-alanine ligase [Planctomycetota bacterium]
MHTGIDGASSGRSCSGFTSRANFNGLHVHLIGIGGSGMSGAASLLNADGAVVSGSDLTAFDGLGQLVSRGVRVFIGHCESQLPPDVELVIISAAVPSTNPELELARSRGLRVIRYAEFLGEFMSTRRGVAVAGTHGKSTTSGMCVHLFQRSGLSPSFVIGARSNQLGGSSGLGNGESFVVESCEFNRSFLHLRPESAAILNIEPDHLDCYRNVEDIVDAFSQFAAGVRQDGLLVCNGEDARAVRAASFASARIDTFGFSHGLNWQAVDLHEDEGRYSFEVRYNEEPLLRASLAIPGLHNVSNALAAIALAHHGGADCNRIAEAIGTFAGVDRRMTLRMRSHGITLLDDYAHHPTEIRVTIDAARSRYRPRRTLVVFQPHQYSRTRHFMDQFADSFSNADEVIVPDIYGAREVREDPTKDGAEELVSRICRRGGRATYLSSLEAVTNHLTSRLSEGDLVMTMGAGDVWKVADELVERFRISDRAERAAGEKDLVSTGGLCAVSVPAA